MAPQKFTSYEDAVLKLNSLQSNSNLIQQLRKRREIFPERNVVETENFLSRIAIKLSSIDCLNIIHVSGTKGKGSTCAFTESILRELGFKTGFYCSPHLVHVRERIRINGQPLDEREFARYFWTVYRRLQRTASLDAVDMPGYFKFLTLMAFHVFIEEKVDVAIIEVGIGGQNDCTNVVRNPIVCGVTTLDYDHTSILGHSLKEIAWQKAGIFKLNSMAVVADPNEDTLEVLCGRARERNHCSKWFLERDESEIKPIRVLIFHCTADRTPETLLPYLQMCNFDMALFCPSRVRVHLDRHSDQANLAEDDRTQLDKCEWNRRVWTTLTSKSTKYSKVGSYLHPNWQSLPRYKCTTFSLKVLPCVEDTLHYIESHARQLQMNTQDTVKMQVLVTGSLHLVGAVIALIDPELSMI